MVPPIWEVALVPLMVVIKAFYGEHASFKDGTLQPHLVNMIAATVRGRDSYHRFRDLILQPLHPTLRQPAGTDRFDPHPAAYTDFGTR